MNITQLKFNITEPALTAIGMMSTAALNLVTGTAIQETKTEYVVQLGGGPALSLWQIEPNTELDIWKNYLAYQPELATKVKSLLAPGPTTPQLIHNFAYAAAMCRIKYYRSPLPLPAYNDANGLANMWKTVYNTSLGAGAVDAATVANFQTAINS